ncbi:hypothetical protein CERZMDRAFT_82826 [Cercospora zeae-maydis SCOH1-5]|uniref:Uncharacterized protein n=1 Tax=Cercospora zeae-maydis SCOH1-5 TaxID=717836 RepID=A0A6A6FNB7_9PEZI|nr:hypothetical protein CERZMDRAFT_82826 [Cercospora zeae-maydis SCOH1-5]
MAAPAPAGCSLLAAGCSLLAAGCSLLAAGCDEKKKKKGERCNPCGLRSTAAALLAVWAWGQTTASASAHLRRRHACRASHRSSPTISIILIAASSCMSMESIPPTASALRPRCCAINAANVHLRLAAAAATCSTRPAILWQRRSLNASCLVSLPYPAVPACLLGATPSRHGALPCPALHCSGLRCAALRCAAGCRLLAADPARTTTDLRARLLRPLRPPDRPSHRDTSTPARARAGITPVDRRPSAAVSSAHPG